MEVIIPTHNGHKHLAKIVKALNNVKDVSCIHIVNNAFDDFATEPIKNVCAENKKCKYHFCAELGKGNAIRTALKHVKDDIFFVDASAERFSARIAESLIAKFNQGFDFVKAQFNYESEESNLLFKCLKQKFPCLKISQPNNGMYCVRKNVLDLIDIPESRHVDFCIMLQACRLGCSITETSVSHQLTGGRIK